MRIAAVSDSANNAISNVKYTGEMASVVCQEEYFTMSSEVFFKKKRRQKIANKSDAAANECKQAQGA